MRISLWNVSPPRKARLSFQRHKLWTANFSADFWVRTRIGWDEGWGVARNRVSRRETCWDSWQENVWSTVLTQGNLLLVGFLIEMFLKSRCFPQHRKTSYNWMITRESSKNSWKMKKLKWRKKLKFFIPHWPSTLYRNIDENGKGY